MPTATRTAVMPKWCAWLTEMVLLIDYRSGPIRFPKGSLFNQ